MRLLDLLIDFDAALDWPLDDPLLADHQPPNGAIQRLDSHGADDPRQNG